LSKSLLLSSTCCFDFTSKKEVTKPAETSNLLVYSTRSTHYILIRCNVGGGGQKLLVIWVQTSTEDPLAAGEVPYKLESVFFPGWGSTPEALRIPNLVDKVCWACGFQYLIDDSF